MFYNIYKFYIILSLNEVRFAEYKTVEVKVQDCLPHRCDWGVNYFLSGVPVHKYPEKHHTQNEPTKSRTYRLGN